MIFNEDVQNVVDDLFLVGNQYQDVIQVFICLMICREYLSYPNPHFPIVYFGYYLNVDLLSHRYLRIYLWLDHLPELCRGPIPVPLWVELLYYGRHLLHRVGGCDTWSPDTRRVVHGGLTEVAVLNLKWINGNT